MKAIARPGPPISFLARVAGFSSVEYTECVNMPSSMIVVGRTTEENPGTNAMNELTAALTTYTATGQTTAPTQKV